MNFETANPQGGVENTPMSEAEHLFEPQSSLAVDAGEAEFEEDGERIDDGEDMPPEDEDAEDFEEEDSEEDGGDDDFVEVDYEGQTYRVPPELKDAFLRNADYTRKTQALASERKKIDEERSFSQRRDQITAANLQDYTRIMALSEQIQKYEAVNWQSLQSQDPATAQRLAQEYAQAKQARNDAAQSFQQRIEQRSRDEQRETARQVAEGHAILSREIPDWSPELGAVLKHFAASNFGLTPDELGNVTDPRLVKILYAALRGELRGQRAAQVEKLSATQRTRPVPQVRAGGATATKNPARMSDAEYIEWRAKGGGE